MYFHSDPVTVELHKDRVAHGDRAVQRNRVIHNRGRHPWQEPAGNSRAAGSAGNRAGFLKPVVARIGAPREPTVEPALAGRARTDVIHAAIETCSRPSFLSSNKVPGRLRFAA